MSGKPHRPPVPDRSMPTCRIRSPCCARATSGHAAQAAIPRMKPRRRIARPQAQDYVTRQLQQGIALGGLRFSVTSQSSNREPPMSPRGSRAGIPLSWAMSRYGSESRHQVVSLRCPLSAKIDQRASYENWTYSMSSSARMRTDRGTSTPSLLAVLRFTSKLILAGNSTGRSAGLVPLRI